MTIDARLRVTLGAFHLDAALTIPATGVTALFGPSGAGKTTLLRALAGLESRAHGVLTVGAHTWQDADIFLPPHKRPVGFVFQEPSLFPHLTVRGNLEYGMKRTPASARTIAFDDAVQLTGVAPFLARRPETLSGGERQRVAIARALLTSPQLLLLDEPLTALDKDSKADILPYLERLHTGLDIPVLYVSHAADEVARLADYLALMDAGAIVAHGPVADMFTRMDLPLAHGDDAAALIEATVAKHDADNNLSALEFPGGVFTVPERALEPGHRVRLRVLARDVSLALEHLTGTSILNIFPATVTAVHDEGAAQVVVRLDVGGVPMLSRITKKSATTLDVTPGKKVYVQVKSVALLT